MELSDRPGFARLQVLQIETSNQVILTPDMLGHQMNLKIIIFNSIHKLKIFQIFFSILKKHHKMFTG